MKQDKNKLVQRITEALFKGDYTLYSSWHSLIKEAQTFPKEESSKQINHFIKKTIAHCDKKIEQKCPLSMTLRALFYQNGFGGEVNFDKAIKLYEQAIQLGCALAMNNRAFLHQTGQGGPVNYPEAIRLFEQAIALGNASAMNNRAMIYETRDGGPKNYPEAIRLYEKAIALGNASAMFHRAYMHDIGRGGPINYPEAIRLLEQAIALGNVNAMIHRAAMHEVGEGGPVNNPEAIKLYEQAIALGHTDAMINLAMIYEAVDGPINPEAIRLYEQAIALGHAGAMINLAMIYEGDRDGGPINYPEAIRLYEQASRFGLDGEVAEAARSLNDLIRRLDKFEKKNIKDLSPTLVSSLWNDLLDGKSFATATLSFLGTHCQKEILKRLTDKNDILSTNLVLLRTLLANKEHPLMKILSHGAAEGRTKSIQTLSQHIDFLHTQLKTYLLVSKKPQSALYKLPLDIRRELLFFVQPGSKKPILEYASKTMKPSP